MLQRLFFGEFLQSDNRWRTIDAIPDPAATRVIELAQTSSRAGSPPSCGCPAGRPWPGATRPLVALPDVIFVPCRPRKAACNAIGSDCRRPITTLTPTLQRPSPQAYLAPSRARGSRGPVADRSAARGTSRLLELQRRAGARRDQASCRCLCGARAGRVDSGRNSERHVPRRKAGARTTSTTGNYRRGFIDQVPGPTAPAGDMAVRNSPASIRRDMKTLQMRM